MSLPRCHALLKFMGMGLMILGGTLPLAFAQNPGRELPVVSAASVPLYPSTALLAHILGSVSIRVRTDGEKISSLNDESGPPMLVQAARENLRTWQFEKHDPTTFLVTFEYRIEEPGVCSVENSNVVLHMPLHVEISAKGVHTCDPASVVPHTKSE
jgi:hypothetical protein